MKWTRQAPGHYTSGSFAIHGEAGISAGWDADGQERFTYVGWLLYEGDVFHGAFITLKGAKKFAEENS